MSEVCSSTGPISINLAHVPTVNFALQQNHVPVVRTLALANALSSDLNDIEVSVSSEPAIFETWHGHVARIPAQGMHAFGSIDLVPAAAFLMSLTEAITGSIHVEARKSGEVIARHSSVIELLAYDDWGGIDRALPDILAAFVLPNHPVVQSILSDAATILGEWSNDTSISGYQSKDSRRCALVAAAIYSAVQSRGIRYCNPPASFCRLGQKVRLPDSIVDHRLATCLDLSLLAAACLEQAGLHPLIVLTHGHAFVGTWLIEECFADAATDEPLRLRKRIDLSEIIVFESTLMATIPKATFNQAMELARDKLADIDAFEAVIDVKRCRRNRIHPIPTRISGAFPSTELVKSVGSGTSVPFVDPNLGAATSSESVAQRETPETRLDRWKRKLLDLTLRNRLINFKESKKTIPLLCPDLAALEDALSDGTRFSLAARPAELGDEDPRSAELHRLRTGEDAMKQILLGEFSEKRLRTTLVHEELDRRTLEVFRTARTSIEEGGASSLFLAVGFLVWYESKTSDQKRLSPIILLPVELQRNSIQEGFRIRQTDEEPRINVTLLELLEKDHDLMITGLDPLPEDEKGLDVNEILNRIRRAIKNIDRWDVIEEAHIGLFSFAKFLMWRDLDVRTKELTTNKVVNHLVYHARELYGQDSGFPNAERLDQDYRPEATFCPLESDSSQLAAVYSASQDRSFVLIGPPGTGKSQTITNLIAHCLATGKTVLFVSEKMAALNVVQSRLEKVGLAPFCLELHSNKSHKMRVIEQLGKALDRVTERSAEQWAREAQRLAVARQELNEYVHAMHRPRTSGESVFRGLSQLISLQNTPHVVWDNGPVEEMTGSRLEDLRDCVDRMMAVGNACGHPAGHVWSGVACTDLGPIHQREVERAIKRLMECVTDVEAASRSACEVLGLGGISNLVTLGFAAKFARFLLTSPRPPAGLLQATDWNATDAKIVLWRKLTERRNSLESRIHERYRDDILSVDLKALRSAVEEARTRWFLPRWFRIRTIWKQVVRFAKDRRSIISSNLGDDLDTACNLLDSRRMLDGIRTDAERLLGDYWRDGRPDWALVDQFREWCGKFRKYVEAVSGADPVRGSAARDRWIRLITEGADQLQPSGPLGQRCSNLVRAYAAFVEAKLALETRLQLDDHSAWNQGATGATLDSIRSRLAAWSDNIKSLRLWCNWQLVRNAAIDAGLASLVRAYEFNGLPTDSLRRVFDRSYYQSWVETMIERDPALRGFTSVEHERRIQRFREMDERFMELTKLEIQARLASRQPSPADRVSQNSETGILRHQVKRRRGHMPVRALFHKIPNLLPRLKPCLLMSPNSVAQYLDPAFPKFDLVVFDEASQIPTWDAVGAIARGTEVVIVGDPKQLPPTNFFNREDDPEVEDDDIVEDLESILDDCIVGQLPQMELRWHYRSRHESLIAFSNHYYYDNKLLTFPSPHLDQGVKFRFVQGGFYDRGKSRTNTVEADAVVAEVVRRLRDPELSRRTIGVVTFSAAQQILIEDKLDEACRSYPEIETYFTSAVPEPVFIKNLENVQGDERDTILFSICYGPDAEGRVSLNFGPINRDGGERRLNVAITRARQEVLVFSTLRAEQLDLSRSNKRGVQDLKSFLDYAERGRVALAEAMTLQHGTEFESPFEKEVFEALRRRGHQVHAQVGCSGYRIDLAVVDPAAEGRYLLGIECDGANYHSAKTARDRDKLREAVLVNLGWCIHRVWSTDWWVDPESELAKIDAAIERASANRLTPKLPAPSVDLPASELVQYAAAPVSVRPGSSARAVTSLPVYRPFQHRIQLGTGDAFYDHRNDYAILKVILDVIKAEGPISLDLLARRVLLSWGLTRRTDSAMARMVMLLRAASVQAVERNGRTFIWPATLDIGSFDSFRVNGDEEDARRAASDIPPEEIAAAARHVLRAQISLPRDELIREVARLLGFQRLGQAVELHVSAGIDFLLESGTVRVADDNIVLEHFE